MEKVLYYINVAKEEGGKIECGGERVIVKGLEKGFFVAPTIVSGYDFSWFPYI